MPRPSLEEIFSEGRPSLDSIFSEPVARPSLESIFLEKNQPGATNAPATPGGVLFQAAVGLGNAAAFSAPELLNKKEFDRLASANPIERVARGTGTTIGSVIGVPGLAFKIGEKIAMAGAAKVIPSLAAKAKGGSLAAQYAIKGIGGMAAVNAVDPTKPAEEKIKEIPQTVLSGAGAGLLGYGVSNFIRAQKFGQIKKDRALRPHSGTVAAKEQVNKIGEIQSPPRELTPSVVNTFGEDGKSVIDLVNKNVDDVAYKTEAVRRGIISDDLAQKFASGRAVDFDAIKPGSVLNEEDILAYRVSLKRQLADYLKNPTVEGRERLINNGNKLQGIASEWGRSGRGLSMNIDHLVDETSFITNNVKNLDPQLKMQLSEVLKDIETPGFWDKFLEMRMAGMLGNPMTFERNFIGNSIYLMFHPFEKIVAGNANKVESFFTGSKRDVFSREAIGSVLGLKNGLLPAMQNAIKAMRDENFKSNSRVWEGLNKRKAVKGKFGEFVRISLRGLNATDEFFSTLANHSALYETAYRQAIKEGGKDIPGRISELIKNPTSRMIAEAAKQTQSAVFRDDLGLFGKQINALVGSAKIGDLPIGRALVPFVKTPLNLFSWTFQRSPITSLLSPKNWRDIKGTPEQRADAIGRVAVGQMTAMGLFLEAIKGNITGRLSDNPRERELLRAQGIQPYSIKIGNKYYSYRSFEPLSSLFAIVANTAEIYKDNRSPIDQNKAMSIVAETLKIMKEQPYLQGLSDVLEGMDNPESRGGKIITNLLTSNIPSGVYYAARLADPTVRDAGRNLTFDALVDSIKMRIPGKSKEVNPRLDVWGRPVTREGNLFERAFSPVSRTTYKPDMTTEELVSLEKFPDRTMAKFRKLDLTVKERNDIVSVEGQWQKTLLDNLVQTNKYQQSSPYQQERMVDSVMSHVRERVRKPFFDQKVREKLQTISDPIERARFLEDITGKELIKE